MADTYLREGETGMSVSGVKTSDTAIKSAPGKVYWLTFYASGYGAIVQINDSTDNSGTDKWQITLPSGGYIHCIFDPPIECSTGIYLDVTTGAEVAVGYI